MTLTFILISIAVAAIVGLFAHGRLRLYLLLAISSLAVFALQPALPVRGLDFWLPSATMGLTVLAWALTSPPEQRTWRENWPAAAIIAGIVLLLGLKRYLDFSIPLTASIPPQFWQILAGVAFIGVLVLVLLQFTSPGKVILTSAFILILLIFVVLKLPAVSTWVSRLCEV